MNTALFFRRPKTAHCVASGGKGTLGFRVSMGARRGGGAARRTIGLAAIMLAAVAPTAAHGSRLPLRTLGWIDTTDDAAAAALDALEVKTLRFRV